MENWTDLKLLLAIARAGTLNGAAKALSVDYTTVYRRLGVLEQQLGTRLFNRLPGGNYEPTGPGQRAVAAAERMEEEALALARDVTGRDLQLSGRLRVTSSETLAYRVLMKHMAVFHDAHPGIIVELAIDNRVLSLSRREADVALRPMRPSEGNLWGKKLADVAWTVYGSKRYLSGGKKPAKTPDQLVNHALIGWEEAGSSIGTAAWLTATVPESAVVYRSNSLINQLMAVRAGIGLAVLPCYLGDPEPDLVRVLPDPIVQLSRELWIVTHADLRNTARIRAFFDIVGEGIRGEGTLLAGKARPGPAKSRKPAET